MRLADREVLELCKDEGFDFRIGTPQPGEDPSVLQGESDLTLQEHHKDDGGEARHSPILLSHPSVDFGAVLSLLWVLRPHLT